MKTLSIVGAILALGAAALLTMYVVLNVSFLSSGTELIISWIIMLSVTVLGIFGGIFGFLEKKAGGLLALGAGILQIIFALWFNTLEWITLNFFFELMLIVGCIVLAGGILLILGGSD